ncbi:hypothetical protein KPG66_13270 [Mycetohabitans sp. B2]|uniref:hypothetical protein n=1 Tax=Mycetohabitans TaxID=2571159 RepID=UPI001F3801B1|nr:hypothetical protein [Mycetohabitans sp. B2]MCF7697017.1 hypothetical protein [Mycetohabitans sp. B2]
MGKPIVVTGAMLVFPVQIQDVLFVPPIPPRPLSGSGFAKVKGRPVCQLGDEKKIIVTASYQTASASIPGVAILTVTQAETAKRTKSPLPVIIAPSWDVLCTITVPAQIPGTPPVPQPHPPVSGKATVMANPNINVIAN